MNSIMSCEYRWSNAARNGGIGRLNAALVSGYQLVGLRRLSASSPAACRALDAWGVLQCRSQTSGIVGARVDLPRSSLLNNNRGLPSCCWRRQVFASINLDSATTEAEKKRVLFLGTPEVGFRIFYLFLHLIVHYLCTYS